MLAGDRGRHSSCDGRASVTAQRAGRGLVCCRGIKVANALLCAGLDFASRPGRPMSFHGTVRHSFECVNPTV